LFDCRKFYHHTGRPPLLDLAECGCETDSIRTEIMPDTQKQIVTVGVTGASGAVLAQKALELLEADARVGRIYLVVTEAGQRLFAEELGIRSGDLKQLPSRLLNRPAAKMEVLPNKDIGASIASGSYTVDSMIVIPCSMGTLAAIATGVSDDLV
jgi:4-hydroxy-3-polyprenylbenzoate decarboxylase